MKMETNPQTPNQSYNEALHEMVESIKNMQDRYKKTINRFGIGFAIIMAVFIIFGVRSFFSGDPKSIQKKDQQILQIQTELVKIRAEKDSLLKIMAQQDETIKQFEQSEIDLIENYNKTQDKLYELDKKSKQSGQRVDRFSSADIKEYFTRQYGQ